MILLVTLKHQVRFSNGWHKPILNQKINSQYLASFSNELQFASIDDNKEAFHNVVFNNPGKEINDRREF